MNSVSDVTQLPDDFEGHVRLFPLPGMVMFPHAMRPLHIFEPRYVELLHESLADDRCRGKTGSIFYLISLASQRSDFWID